MVIEKAKMGEEKEITKIYNEATLELLKENIYQWKYPFFVNEIKNEILLNNLYVVKNNNEIIGCFGLKEIKSSDYDWNLNNNDLNHYFFKLVVKLSWRGKGVYSKIINYIKEYSHKHNSKMYLTCYSNNIKNNEIYCNSGFKIHKVCYDCICDDSLKYFFEYKVYILNK